VAVKPVPAVLPPVLAKVNGEDVQKWELDTALKQAEASAGSSVPPDKRDVVLRNILDELINYHMLAQEARGLKIQATDAEVDAQLAMIRKSFPTEEAYQQALLLQGVTVQQLRDVTRRTLDAQKLVDTEVTSKVAVQDADVDAFYNQNLERFKQGDTVHASHIFIAVPPNAVPAQKEQARATAERILKQLRAGADFATLAKTESNDASAAKGGDLGFIAKGDVPPDFEKVAFGLKPGTTSGVVELESGFHIIKVTERRGPRTAPLSEVREDVKGFLKQQQTQTKLADYIGQIKAKAKIQVLV
jgi:peptidyl-prolyl cis-trans isomerase C